MCQLKLPEAGAAGCGRAMRLDEADEETLSAFVGYRLRHGAAAGTARAEAG